MQEKDNNKLSSLTSEVSYFCVCKHVYTQQVLFTYLLDCSTLVLDGMWKGVKCLFEPIVLDPQNIIQSVFPK